MPIKKFVCGASMSRGHLLKGKAKAWQKMMADFLRHRHVRFDTKFGNEKLKELMAEHGIVNTDESVIAFVQSIGGEIIGILCYQVDNDYIFTLVSGSKPDLLRMMKNGSTNRNPNISIG